MVDNATMVKKKIYVYNIVIVILLFYKIINFMAVIL